MDNEKDCGSYVRTALFYSLIKVFSALVHDLSLMQLNSILKYISENVSGSK